MKTNQIEIKNILMDAEQTEDTAKLYLYGEVVGSEWMAWSADDVYPAYVRDFLEKVKDKELEIHINSPGGDVFAGITIYNMLARHTGKKTAYIDGLAASIASVIPMCADEIVMYENAMLMMHKPWTRAAGNADDLADQIKVLEKCEQSIISMYRSKLKDSVSDAEIKQMLKAETWLTAQEAQETFDGITLEGAAQIAACAEERYFDRYRKTPEQVRAVCRERSADAAEDAERDAEIEKIKLELSLV